ncbi:bifunctional 2-polyprenyl-6-hydroxyphenol methylase/3-demethylubiquinol 3-O-methyltransferase UbiG [Amycolatopsis sp. MJM2582]|uniref:class I SAM-dependent methyltransferase n=1 Tax=Amycolatopsis sp. MJM2582 TaxID=1427749 RepID=UPI00068CA7EA|nr:class I SAM-dependent methyltransferase [Amycolatopsis sp. MJM2582]
MIDRQPMVASSAYAYPDDEDRITRRFIEQAEPHPGYWDHSDERAMARAAEKLKELLGPKDSVRALDVGCGPGRMLPWLSELAGRVTAIDPDPGRLAKAAQVARELGDSAEIVTQVGNLHELRAGPFDLVLCSHVIQHIPTADLVPLLNSIRELITPDGVLMLSCTRAPVGDEKFSLDRMTEHGVESHRVDRARFDEVARAATGKEGLPIHHRDPIRLAELGRSLGWAQVWTWSFHVLEPLPEFDISGDRDEWVNGSPELLRRFGRDAVVLWRLQTSTG